VHLNARVQKLLLEGFSKEEAEYLAVEGMGPVEPLNRRFLGHVFTYRTGWVSLAALVLGLGVLWASQTLFVPPTGIELVSTESALPIREMLGKSAAVKITLPRNARFMHRVKKLGNEVKGEKLTDLFSGVDVTDLGSVDFLPDNFKVEVDFNLTASVTQIAKCAEHSSPFYSSYRGNMAFTTYSGWDCIPMPQGHRPDISNLSAFGWSFQERRIFLRRGLSRVFDKVHYKPIEMNTWIPLFLYQPMGMLRNEYAANEETFRPESPEGPITEELNMDPETGLDAETALAPEGAPPSTRSGSLSASMFPPKDWVVYYVMFTEDGCEFTPPKLAAGTPIPTEEEYEQFMEASDEYKNYEKCLDDFPEPPPLPTIQDVGFSDDPLADYSEDDSDWGFPLRLFERRKPAMN